MELNVSSEEPQLRKKGRPAPALLAPALLPPMPAPASGDASSKINNAHHGGARPLFHMKKKKKNLSSGIDRAMQVNSGGRTHEQKRTVDLLISGDGQQGEGSFFCESEVWNTYPPAGSHQYQENGRIITSDTVRVPSSDAGTRAMKTTTTTTAANKTADATAACAGAASSALGSRIVSQLMKIEPVSLPSVDAMRARVSSSSRDKDACFGFDISSSWPPRGGNMVRFNPTTGWLPYRIIFFFQ